MEVTLSQIRCGRTVNIREVRALLGSACGLALAAVAGQELPRRGAEHVSQIGEQRPAAPAAYRRDRGRRAAGLAC